MSDKAPFELPLYYIYYESEDQLSFRSETNFKNGNKGGHQFALKGIDNNEDIANYVLTAVNKHQELVADCVRYKKYNQNLATENKLQKVKIGELRSLLSAKTLGNKKLVEEVAELKESLGCVDAWEMPQETLETIQSLKQENEKLRRLLKWVGTLMAVLPCPENCHGGHIPVQIDDSEWTSDQCEWCAIKTAIEQVLKEGENATLD